MLTVVALASVWLLNHNDDGDGVSDDGDQVGGATVPTAGPTVGATVEATPSIDGTPSIHGTPSIDGTDDAIDDGLESPATIEPMTLDESIYLSGDGTEQPDIVVDVAVPAAEEGEVVSAVATFSRNFSAGGLCVGGPGGVGTVLTVTNVNNNRSTVCKVVSGAGIIEPEPGTVVLERAAYLQIADVSDAPVPVELRR